MKSFIFSNSLKKYIFGLLLISILLFLIIVFRQSFAQQICIPLNGVVVWPGSWVAGTVPVADNQQYFLANSPISVSGSNVGIGNPNPSYKFQVNGDIAGSRIIANDGDVIVSTQGKGVILKATDGSNCYRLTVNNVGALETNSITCP